jgi:peptidoglycan hydrolase-like protein with peptidoglycan-binding domain
MVNNSDVFKLQETLAALKFFDFSPTGNFYGITLKAVKEFQKANNISPVSGYVGPLTRDALNKLNK